MADKKTSEASHPLLGFFFFSVLVMVVLFIFMLGGFDQGASIPPAPPAQPKEVKVTPPPAGTRIPIQLAMKYVAAETKAPAPKLPAWMKQKNPSQPNG